MNAEKAVFELLFEIDKRLQRLESILNKSNYSDRNIFISPYQAAQYLNISISTIYKYSSGGKLKFYKTGKKIYFKIDDLNDFISKNPIHMNTKKDNTNHDIDKESEKIIKSINKQLRNIL